MVLAPTPRQFTEEEYLLVDRRAEERSEYLDGQIFAKTGASIAHNLIATNTTSALHRELDDRSCRVFQSDLRVKLADSGLYAYPNIVVACEPLVTPDALEDTLENPSLSSEILSPSTESYDRGEKLIRYQRLPSLRHYLLVAQDRMKVDHYARVETGRLLQTHETANAVVRLEDLGVILRLSAIYANVLSSQ